MYINTNYKRFPYKSKFISYFVFYNCMCHYYYIWHWCTDINPDISEIYNVNYSTHFDNATQIRTSDTQQCQTISAIVTIIFLIIAFMIMSQQ